MTIGQPSASPLSRPPPPNEEDIRQGDVVGSGRWEILDDGTAGGMATVFRARDTRTNGEVALKVIALRYVGRIERERRFTNEGRLAARLKGHRNIAAPIETGVLADRGNRMYLAMELARGPTLLDYISMNGPLPLEKACSCVRDISRALRDLHASEVVHRDVTPSNVIMIETGVDVHVAKLIDFGLAADFGSDARQQDRLTRVGELPGTPHYMSPEQCWGEGAHPTFDVYGLGALFFEMLFGEPPFSSLDDVEVRARKCDLAQPGPPVHGRRLDVPDSIADLIVSCLEPRFDARLASTGLFVVRLDEIRALLGYVDPHAGETTGVVGQARTIEQPKREPKLKQILADAQTARDARERAELREAVTRPVAAPATPSDLTAPTPAADKPIAKPTALTPAASLPRPGRAHTEPVESGEGTGKRTWGGTEPASAADAAVVRRQVHTELAESAASPSPRRVALIGAAVGLLIAIPVAWWATGGGGARTGEPAPGAASMTSFEVASAAASGAAHERPPAPQGEGVPVVDDDDDDDDDGIAIDGADEPAADDEEDDTPAADETPAVATTAKPAVDDAPSEEGDSDDGSNSDSGAGKPAVALTPRPGVSAATTERCVNDRSLAKKARLAGHFAVVLTHTRARECWPSANERTELRVRAFSELSRYEECVKAGARSTDVGIERMVSRCRKKLGQ